jgi:hypothetical protein
MTLAENIIREIEQSEKETFGREEVLQIIKYYTSSHCKPDLESNGIVLSPEKHLIYIEGNKKLVPKRVFDLLYYLIENKNKVSTREIILRDVWGTEVCVNHRTIDVHIRKIRALGVPFIKTLKQAYMWCE